MTKIWKASLDTTNYEFEGYGATGAEARAALRRAIRTHCEQTNFPPESFRDNHKGMIVSRLITLGQGYRDREPLE